MMCAIKPEEVALGTDGCSAPNFAIPLQNAALGLARLCDPHDLPAKRAAACQTITAAMTAHPRMVSGNGRFDTCLMEVTQGHIICKGGAEGYLGMGIMPGVLAPNEPGMGITIKIADGDLRGRARPAIALEVLRQLGALSPTEFEKLSTFGPKLTVRNWRQLNVGESYPIFVLN
jgi:L-asparaginase II